MKLKVLMVIVSVAVLCLFAVVLYAANGDLVVNGNLGVGTGPTPQAKAHVKGDAIVEGNLVTSGTTSLGGNVTINGTIGTSNAAQKLNVNGGIKVTAPSFYVSTSGCYPGDTAVAYRTIPNSCSVRYEVSCGESCDYTIGSCTTGYHGWGTSSAYETCSYDCAYGPTYCTCGATQATLCNPGP